MHTVDICGLEAIVIDISDPPKDVELSTQRHQALSHALLTYYHNPDGPPLNYPYIGVFGGVSESQYILSCKGARIAAKAFRAAGFRYVVCHENDVAEMSDIPGIIAVSFTTVYEVVACRFLRPPSGKPPSINGAYDDAPFDLSDVLADKLPLLIDILTAVKCGHRLLVYNALGALSLIRRILPLIKRDAKDIDIVRDALSATGLSTLSNMNNAPLRIPHPTVSAKGLFGTELDASGLTRYGEVDLARSGVLLLDDIDNFSVSNLLRLKERKLGATGASPLIFGLVEFEDIENRKVKALVEDIFDVVHVCRPDEGSYSRTRRYPTTAAVKTMLDAVPGGLTIDGTRALIRDGMSELVGGEE